LIPSGFEPVLSPEGRLRATRGSLDYVDTREDRVIAYTRAGQSATVLEYRIRATHQGEFFVPASYGEHLYQPNIKAIGEVSKIKVDP